MEMRFNKSEVKNSERIIHRMTTSETAAFIAYKRENNSVINEITVISPSGGKKDFEFKGLTTEGWKYVNGNIDFFIHY